MKNMFLLYNKLLLTTIIPGVQEHPGHRRLTWENGFDFFAPVRLI